MTPLSPEDAALVEEVARRVVERRMGAPAVFLLESLEPLGFVTSQAMVFFQPMLAAFFDTTQYDRLTRILERREAIALLRDRIEALEQGGGGEPL